MAGISAVFLALVIAVGIAGVVILVDRLLQGPSREVQAHAQAAASPKASPAQSAEPVIPPHRPPTQVEEGDEEITIVGFAPITLDDSTHADWADSEVNEEEELGQTTPIVHDPAAADDEPSASHALILVSAVGQTHRGLRRSNNQDAYLVRQEHHVFVVADGMGGYAGGEIASQLTVETIEKAFDENEFRGSYPRDVHRDGGQLAAAIQMANRAIWDMAKDRPDLEGMGTTAVAARFSPRRERIYIGHVGDSRCYRYRDGTFEMLTQDHNLAQMGVKGRNGHMLTRAVGIGPAVEVDLILAKPAVGDRYLLCSDGLNKMLSDQRITEELEAEADPEKVVETLVNLSNEAGGKDNVTVIIVEVRAP